MDEIKKTIHYYLQQVMVGKVYNQTFEKYHKSFLKYFTDQMRDGFPGTRRRNIWPFANTDTNTLGFSTEGSNITTNQIIWNTNDTSGTTDINFNTGDRDIAF